MERVAFLIERTGQRIECLLNPETFTITRLAGVRPHRSLSGVLTGTALADDPLLATGGGTTEFELELLFDVSKLSAPAANASVQTLTKPLWDMAENSEVHNDGYGAPPLVRFVWGKSWNIPAVVVAVAERFEHFTTAGVPQRSWIKLRLLRCAVRGVAAERHSATDLHESLINPAESFLDVEPDDIRVHEVQGDPIDDDGANSSERIDQLAHRYYGDASLWRALAAFNNVDDPARLAVGTGLMVPPLVAPR